jgi:hypothetical protein
MWVVTFVNDAFQNNVNCALRGKYWVLLLVARAFSIIKKNVSMCFGSWAVKIANDCFFLIKTEICKKKKEIEKLKSING